MIKDEGLSGQGQAYWLALLRTPGLGATMQRQLLDDFGSPETIFQSGRNALSRYKLKLKTLEFLQSPDWNKVESDLCWLDKPGNHLLTFQDPGYPLLLKQIYDPPAGLYVRGDPGILNAMQIGIVGSRKPSPDGRRITREFALQLANLGLTVTSGLAAGLDSHAHSGALQGSGTTIAVLGSGLDVIYPAQNRGLAESVMNQGALVSELPPEYKPIPANFPRRNRIISGMSLGTLVVEAGLRSGSLITARLALEQGREVFAVPGSIYNPLSRGCHQLLRQGAKLVEKIEDIIEELGPLAATVLPPSCQHEEKDESINGLDEHCKLLLDNIGKRPVSVDSLVEETKLVVNVVSSSLLQLELKGLVESLSGGEYIRIN